MANAWFAENVRIFPSEASDNYHWIEIRRNGAQNSIGQAQALCDAIVAW